MTLKDDSTAGKMGLVPSLSRLSATTRLITTNEPVVQELETFPWSTRTITNLRFMDAAFIADLSSHMYECSYRSIAHSDKYGRFHLTLQSSWELCSFLCNLTVCSKRFLNEEGASVVESRSGAVFEGLSIFGSWHLQDSFPESLL